MAVTEKRPLDDNVYCAKYIVMDIEGTTTSISFVKDTLFPYVRQHLGTYLTSHWDEDEFKSVLALLKDQAAEDLKAAMEGAVEIPSEGSDEDVKTAIAKSVLWQMDADRKTTALKKLQGHMWRQGYKNGELKGHLFGDVAPALKKWVDDGRKLFVYSSGSVEAQKLLFGNSVDGNLIELFTDFFDTEVGAKVEASSYKSILKKLECNADDVLFLTDLPKEASAAREAGLPVILVEREGNEPIASELRKEFSTVASFQEVSFEATSKKQKLDEESKTSEEVKCEVIKEDTKPVEENVGMDVDLASDSAGKPDSGIEVEAMEVESGKADITASEPEAVKNEAVKEGTATGEEKKCELKETTRKSAPEEVKSVGDGEPSKEKNEEEEKKTVEDMNKKVDKEVIAVTDVVEKTDEEVTKQKTEVLIHGEVDKESEKLLSKDIKTDETKTKADTTVEATEATSVDCSVESKVEKVIKVAEEKVTLTEKGTPQETPYKENTKEDVKPKEENSDSTGLETENIAGTENPLETKECKSEKAGMVTGGGNEDEVPKGTSNGTSNGTANGTKDGDTNGTVENGHGKGGKDDIPEVIIAKNAPQIDTSADAGVVLEA